MLPMPNLVVYVPAGLWRRLDDLGLDDPKVEARKVMVGALQEFLGSGVESVATSPATAETEADGSLVPAPDTSSKRRRSYPCKHHFPPSKHCTFGCDD